MSPRNLNNRKNDISSNYIHIPFALYIENNKKNTNNTQSQKFLKKGENNEITINNTVNIKDPLNERQSYNEKLRRKIANILNSGKNKKTKKNEIKEKINDKHDKKIKNDVIKFITNKEDNNINNNNQNLNNSNIKYNPIFIINNETQNITKKGRRATKNNSKVHLASDYDNILTKVQVHFLSFIINFMN